MPAPLVSLSIAFAFFVRFFIRLVVLVDRRGSVRLAHGVCKLHVDHDFSLTNNNTGRANPIEFSQPQTFSTSPCSSIYNNIYITAPMQTNGKLRQGPEIETERALSSNSTWGMGACGVHYCCHVSNCKKRQTVRPIRAPPIIRWIEQDARRIQSLVCSILQLPLPCQLACLAMRHCHNSDHRHDLPAHTLSSTTLFWPNT